MGETGVTDSVTHITSRVFCDTKEYLPHFNNTPFLDGILRAWPRNLDVVSACYYLMISKMVSMIIISRIGVMMIMRVMMMTMMF